MANVFDNLGHSDFAAHVGTSFEAGGTTLELITADALPETAGGAVVGFSLLFRGQLTMPIDQGMRELTHPVLGTGALFLVPVHDLDAAARYYEAIFQRVDATKIDRRANPHPRTSP